MNQIQTLLTNNKQRKIFRTQIIIRVMGSLSPSFSHSLHGLNYKKTISTKIQIGT